MTAAEESSVTEENTDPVQEADAGPASEAGSDTAVQDEPAPAEEKTEAPAEESTGQAAEEALAEEGTDAEAQGTEEDAAAEGNENEGEVTEPIYDEHVEEWDDSEEFTVSLGDLKASSDGKYFGDVSMCETESQKAILSCLNYYEYKLQEFNAKNDFEGGSPKHVWQYSNKGALGSYFANFDKMNSGTYKYNGTTVRYCNCDTCKWWVVQDVRHVTRTASEDLHTVYKKYTFSYSKGVKVRKVIEDGGFTYNGEFIKLTPGTCFYNIKSDGKSSHTWIYMGQDKDGMERIFDTGHGGNISAYSSQKDKVKAWEKDTSNRFHTDGHRAIFRTWVNEASDTWDYEGQTVGTIWIPNDMKTFWYRNAEGGISKSTDEYIPPEQPSISLKITADKTEMPAPKAGNVITYTYEITNDGEADLSDTEISQMLSGITAPLYNWNSQSDPELEEGTSSAGSISPGETVTATATYAIKQSDIDNGSVTNRASVSGKDRFGTEVTDDAEVTTTLAQNASMSFKKTVDKASLKNIQPGEQLTYRFTAVNTGNTTEKEVAISDPMLEKAGVTVKVTWPAGKTGELGPGERATGIATYKITDTDIRNGSVNNTATVSSKTPLGNAVGPVEAAAVTTISDTGLDIVVSADKAQLKEAKPGDKVTFTAVVTNVSSDTVTGTEITSSLAGAEVSAVWPADAGILKPREKTTAVITYTITEADIQAGTVTCTASASAKDKDGENIGPVSGNAKTDIINTGLSVSVTADRTSIDAPKAGDKISYTIEITNNGNGRINGTTFSAPVLERASVPVNFAWSGEAGTLGAGENVTAKAVYTVTQADIDAGKVDVRGTASAKAQDGTSVGPVSGNAVTELARNAALTVDMTVDKEKIKKAKPGEELSYTVTITNNGNVTETDFAAVDKVLEEAGSPLSFTWPGESGILAPGGKATAKAVYKLTEKDIKARTVINTVSVTAKDPAGNTVGPVSASAKTSLINAELEFTMTVDKTDIRNAKAGDVLNYSYKLVNKGNTAVSSVDVSDPMLEKTGTAPEMSWTGEAGVVEAGSTVTGNAAYRITLEDIANESVKNTASVTAKDPDGEQVGPLEDTAETKFDNEASIEVSVSSDRDVITDAKPGMTVEYTITGTNTGYKVMKDVQLSNGVEGASELTTAWPGDEGVLNPGEKAIASTSYAITQDDIDRGYVEYTVHTTAPGTDIAPAKVRVMIEQKPAVSVTVTTDEAILTDAKAGDPVVFHIEAQNMGNVSLSEVSVTGSPEGISAPEITWPGGEGILMTDGKLTASAVYRLTQDDIDNGRNITGMFTVTAKAPAGNTVTDSDTAETVPVAKTSLTIEKDVDKELVENGKPGDKVTYNIIITNNGNTTAYSVDIQDELLKGTGDIVIDWSSAKGEGTMLPGQTVTVTADYALTQADIDAGKLLNVASVTCKAPDGTAAGPFSDDAETSIERHTAITIKLTTEKDLLKDASAGDKVPCTAEVMNTGNTTARKVALTSAMLEEAGLVLSPEWPSGEAVLAPGEKITAAAEYTLTQADIDAGRITIDVKAEAEGPDGTAAQPAQDELTVEIEQVTSIAVAMTADKELVENGVAGDDVLYTVTVTNNGNTTAWNTRLTDPMLEGAGIELALEWPKDREMLLAPEGKTNFLLPGESVTAVASYALTQKDMDEGEVINVVTAEAEGPDKEPAEAATAEVRTEIVQLPSLAVVLTADPASVEDPKVGQQFSIALAITNNGNVTVSRISTLLDMLADHGIVLEPEWQEGSENTLVPGETAAASAAGSLTQADIDRGYILVQTAVEGTSPKDVQVGPVSCEAKTELARKARLTLSKKADRSDIKNAKAGDKVNYSYVLRNEGNTTISGAEITDRLPGLSEITYNWKEEVTEREFALDREKMVYHFDCEEAAEITEGNMELFCGTPAEAEAMGFTACEACRPASCEGVLLPGEEVTASASYSVTEADIKAGKVTNVAFASGHVPVNDPGAEAVTVESETAKAETALHAPAKKSPKTGDAGGMMLWTVLFLAAGVSAAVSRKARSNG